MRFGLGEGRSRVLPVIVVVFLHLMLITIHLVINSLGLHVGYYSHLKTQHFSWRTEKTKQFQAKFYSKTILSTKFLKQENLNAIPTAIPKVILVSMVLQTAKLSSVERFVIKVGVLRSRKW